MTNTVAHREGGAPGRLAFFAVSIVHLAGCLLFFPPAEIFSGEPLLSSDYVFHFLEGARIGELLGEGAFWGYSTRWAAGAPVGFLAMINSKPYALALALAPPGAEPLVFNLLVLALLFAFPPLVYAAARELGLTRGEAALAMFLVLVCWYGSALFRIFWRGGSVLFVTGCGAALWIVARLHRLWTTPPAGRRAWVELAAAAALLPWLHPLPMAVVAIGGSASFAATFRRRGWRLGTLAALAAVVLVANLAWLGPWVAHADLRQTFDYGTLAGGPEFLLFDLVTGPLHLAPWHRGELAVLGPLAVAAAAGFAAIASRPDLRILLAGLAGGLAVLAYGAGTIDAIAVLQPHRFAMPLAATAAIAAGLAPGRLRAPRSALGRRIAPFVVVLLVLFFADRLRVASHSGDYLASGLDRADAFALEALRTHAADAEGRIASRVLLEGEWRSERVAGRRVAKRVSYTFVALERHLDAEWIGAPIMVTGLWQQYASFWQGTVFGRNLDAFDEQEFLAASELYDVGWVATVTAASRARLESFAPAVEKVAADGDVAIFRVRRAADRTWRGEAEVTASATEILVEAGAPGPVGLKYHWIPGLVASPPAAVRGVSVDPRSPCRFVEIDVPAAGVYRIGLRR